MGRHFLRHGFKLKDVMYAMLVPDQSGNLRDPEIVDEFGKKYSSSNEALQAVSKGTTVMIIEHPHNNLSNMVTIGLHKDGSIALSPSKTVDYEKTMDMFQTVANPPSRGRRLAYNLFGRFAKNSFKDIKKYEEQTAKNLSFINKEIKPEMRKHIDSDPIEFVETMEGSTYSMTMASIDRKTEAYRAKYKDYVPGVSPIHVNFVAPEIMGQPAAFKEHARKQAYVLSQDTLLKDNTVDYYPGLEKRNLTKTQKDILQLGLQCRTRLYIQLGEGHMTEKVNYSRETRDILPSIAAATYVHKALVNQYKDFKYSKILSYLENPKNYEKFMNALTERFNDTDFTVGDIHTLLETPAGAEIFMTQAEKTIDALGPEIEAYEPGAPEKPLGKAPEKAAAKTAASAPAKGKTVVVKGKDYELSWTEDEPAAEATKAEPNEVKQEERIPLEREHGIPLERETRTRFDDDPEDSQEYTTVDLALMRKGGIAAEKIKEQLAASKGKACEFNTDDVADLIIGRVASLGAANSEVPGLRDARFAHTHLNEAGDNATFIKIFLKEELEREPLTESKLAKFMAVGGEKEMINLVNKAIDAELHNEVQFANEQEAKANAKVQKIQAEKKVDVEMEVDTDEMRAEYDELQVSGAAHNRMQLPINEIQISADTAENSAEVKTNVPPVKPGRDSRWLQTPTLK